MLLKSQVSSQQLTKCLILNFFHQSLVSFSRCEWPGHWARKQSTIAQSLRHSDNLPPSGRGHGVKRARLLFVEQINWWSGVLEFLTLGRTRKVTPRPPPPFPGGLWRHQSWSPSWPPSTIFSRIRNQGKNKHYFYSWKKLNKHAHSLKNGLTTCFWRHIS